MRTIPSLVFIVVAGLAQAQFSWPAGISNMGPYALASGVVSSTVFAPSGTAPTENDVGTHQYNHHTRIAATGTTLAIAFSSANTNEQDGGQQCAIAFSSDSGQNWSAAIQVVPSPSNWTNAPNLPGSRISYPRNFTTYGSQLYLTCAIDDVLDTNGHVQGATLLSCAVYPNQTIGPLFRIVATNCATVDGKSIPDYDSTLGPPLLADSKIYGCWGGSSTGGVASDWNGWVYGLTGNFVEPNTVSADGGTDNLWKIWRCVGAADTHLIYVMSSTNGGSTWPNLPVANSSDSASATGIPNSPSETTIIRLTTGQFAIIGNPVNNPGLANRDPLFLALTSPGSTTIISVSAVRQGLDGVPTYPGQYKNGGAAYPSACQFGNSIAISYSVAKESIGFSLVPIPTIINASSARISTVRMAP